MSGMAWLATGGGILAGATVIVAVVEIILQLKKRKIRREVYQIYD